MSETPHNGRKLLLIIGLPAFLTGAVVAVILFELPGTLFSAVVEEDDDDAKVHVTSSPPPEDELPRPQQQHTTRPAADPRTKTYRSDLLADLAHVEMEVDGKGRYVSLEKPSGLWSLEDPSVLARKSKGVWKAGEGMPFAGASIRLSLHQDVSSHRCLFVEIQAQKTFELTAHSGGRKATIEVPGGRNVLETFCAKDEPAGESMLVTLEPVQPVPPETHPRLVGLWLAREETSLDARTPPPCLTTCPDSGFQVLPGVTLHVRGMGEKGDRLELQASGEGAERMNVSVRSAGRNGDMLTAASIQEGDSGEDPVTKGAWELGLERTRPVEISISLRDDAPGPACLQRLELVHEPPGPAMDISEMPDIRGVIFVLMDTLRFDALPAFHSRSPVETPTLTEIASHSVLFTNATAHSNYTKPTVASILTGVYPHATGGLPHKGVLTSEVPLVSQLLHQAGIHTVGLFSNRFLNEKFNFMRGWDHDAHVNSFKACVDGDITAHSWVEFIDSYNPEDPFFLYIHLMDPHAPYVPRSTALEIKYVGRRVLDGRFSPLSTAVFIRELRRGNEKAPEPWELQQLKGLYRADVAGLDATIQRIFEALELEGLTDQAMVILAADHGEEFMEHGYMGHGTNIHPELTHVPVMIRLPGDAVTGTYDDLVGQIDMTPTILDALGVDVPEELWGESLIHRIGTPAVPGDPPAYLLEHWNGTYGLRLGHWLIIDHNRNTSLARIQDQQVWYQDPSRHPVLWLYLRQRLALEILSNRGEGAKAKNAHIDTETRQQLEALGYILD